MAFAARADGRGLNNGSRAPEAAQHGSGNVRRMRREVFLFPSLLVTARAGTLFPEICEIVMAAVMIRPDDIDAGAGRNSHLDVGGLFARIQGIGITFLPVYRRRAPCALEG